MKIKTRIALVFTALTGIMLLMLSSAVYLFSIKHSHDNFFARLKVRAAIAAESRFMVDEAKSLLVNSMRGRHLQALPREREFFLTVDSTLIKNAKSLVPELSASFIETIVVEGFGEYNRGFKHFSGLRYTSGSTDYIVIASAYDENSEEEINFLRKLLIFGVFSSTILVFVIGRIFAFRIMKPIMSIISRVNNITANNLHERVRTLERKDELAEIINTFNAMLDRLETAFELQGHFISNASHELRTPLTAILGEAEVTLQMERTPSYYEASIKTMQCEAKRLEDLTSSLLRLSQISYDGKKQKIEPVMVDELLMSIKIGLDQRMPDNNVRILVQEVPDNADVYGLVCSRVWMELALTNIINNSIKYSDNKEVLVTLSASEKEFFVQISDYGIGIPAEEIQHIFEPFFRGSNTFRYTGYGIGLPLVEKIIRLHGGKIHIYSKAGSGTKVTLQFPQNPKLKFD